MGKKRIIALGDLHCGHVGGLTPPGWQTREDRNESLYKLQSEMWRKYRALILKYTKNYDGKLIVVCNGDAIDGNRNIGECITSDRSEQVDMATKCLQPWNADQYVFTTGTPFHIGKEENWESILAERFNSTVSGENYLDADGCVFYFRHKIGRSGVPYGKNTALAKKKIWNKLRSIDGEVPNADILCFSHVHYHTYCGESSWMAMTLPALQTVSDYGQRECDGKVDWGITTFDLNNGKLEAWGTDVVRIKNAETGVTAV
jgi:hypothetical protein